MVQFDNQYRQVKLKVVYYGPGLGGKTTCLQYIHRATDPQRRTKLYALNTASDRTLFFDLLSLDLGRIRGYRVMLQLYTVPGQVQYNATRRAVLSGADGVVFVVDSQRSMMEANLESLANLAENLKINGLDPERLPLVFQYNKRDLPEVVPLAELDRAFNTRKCPAFEAVATQGSGVLEGFAAIAEATVVAVADRLGLGGQKEVLQRLVAGVRSALQPLLPSTPQASVDSTVVIRPASHSESLKEEELISEAVRANLAMTDVTARLDSVSKELERRVANLRSINEFSHIMSLAREPEEVTSAFFERLHAELKVTSGVLLIEASDGQLLEVLRRGLSSDPLSRQDASGRSPAGLLLAAQQPYATRLDELEPAQLVAAPWLEEVRALGFVAMLAVPLLAQGRPLGLVTAYADQAKGGFDDEELELATVMAGSAAVSLANARAWRALEQAKVALEGAVAERTRDLAASLENARSLAEQLEDRNLALEAANKQLRDLEGLKGDLLNRVARELNTPVTAIQTAARILSRYNEVPAEKAAKFVEIITQESGRLADLIASALQAAALGVPEGQAARQPIVLTELIKKVLAPLKGEIQERGIAAQLRVAAGFDRISGDVGQLEAALGAVIKNAVEFNKTSGNVAILVRPVRRHGASFIELRVEDTGLGISPQDLPHVCEVFWQGGNVLTGKPRGLGLGLAVARRVAENHGGTLEIASEQGRGTAVSIFLPPSEETPV